MLNGTGPSRGVPDHNGLATVTITNPNPNPTLTLAGFTLKMTFAYSGTPLNDHL